MEALVSEGANCTMLNVSGHTPLDLACQNGHAQVGGHTCMSPCVWAWAAIALIAFRFPKSTAVTFFQQVVGLLLRSGQFSQAYLQRSDMPHTALLLAAKQGNNEVIGLLVKHGFDVNRRLPGSQGTCLHEAALYGKVDTVRYLLQVRPSTVHCSGMCNCHFLYHSVVLTWQLSMLKGLLLWTLSTCTQTLALLV